MPYKDSQAQEMYQRQYYEQNKDRILQKSHKRKQKIYDWYNTYKNQCKCFFCSESNPVCIDFHHIDPGTKRGSISAMVSDAYSINSIKKEITKCISICASCHRKLHSILP